MLHRSMQRTLVSSAIAILVLSAGLVLGPALHAQDDGAKIVVGTYKAQEVAQAVNFQENLRQQIQGLQGRMQQAQQSGDQAAMQQIQNEARQMQQDATQKLLDRINSVMPQVAEATGAQVIATEVSYAAPGVSTKDVTQAVIDALKAAAPQDDGAMGAEDKGGAMDESGGGSPSR